MTSLLADASPSSPIGATDGRPRSREALLRVLLDISVLGVGHLDNRARAGIFRAAESMMDGLLSRPDLDVYLTAGRGPTHALGTELYARTRGQHLRTRLIDAWRFPPGVRALAFRQLAPETVRRREKSLRSLWRLVRPLRERIFPRRRIRRSFDIHHSLFYPLGPPSVVRARARFITVYDTIPLAMPELFEKEFVETFRRDMAMLARHTDWIVCISDATKRDLCEAVRIRPDRVFVIPLAAADAFRRESDRTRVQAALKRYGISGAPYMLSVSTLEPRKNLAHLIRCFCRIAREPYAKELRLVLVGAKGWLYGDILKAVEEARELRDRVLFTGYVADSDLASVYSGAEFFVYPSLYEGFGLPPLEAMRCGLPVIASNTSSLPEVVGDAGILVPPRDDGALCQAIRRLLEDRNLRSELAARALRQAARFSWSRSVDRLTEAYRFALAETP